MSKKTRRHRAARLGSRLNVEALEDRIVLTNNWHNFEMPLDVSGDSELSTDDAMLVIDALNHSDFRSPNAERPPSGIAVNSGYLDVNDDGHVNPTDALHVINSLDPNQTFYSYDRLASTSATSSDSVATSIADHAANLRIDNALRDLSWWPDFENLTIGLEAENETPWIDLAELTPSTKVPFESGEISDDLIPPSELPPSETKPISNDGTHEQVPNEPDETIEEGSPTDAVVTDPLAAYRLKIVDADGKATNSIAPGETFTLIAYAEDLRQVPDNSETGQGLFAAYLDVEYDSSAVTTVGEIVHGETYLSGRSGWNETAGLLNEAGGFAGLSSVGLGELEVFRQSFIAGDTTTTIVFSSNKPDDSWGDTLLYGLNHAIDPQRIDFGSQTLTIS